MKKLVLFFILVSFGVFGKEKKSYYEVDYNVDIPITISAILIGVMPPMLMKKLPSYMEGEKLDKNNVNSFDSLTIDNYNNTSATVSDYVAISMALAPFAFNLIDNTKSAYLKESLIIVESIAISSALNAMLKYSVNRPRPYIYSGKANGEQKSNRDAHLSFYSGHAAFAFSTAVSFASIMNNRFDKTWQKSLIWGLPLTLASTVAFLRVHAGKHFLSDVITGAVIGSSIGYLVPYLHKKSGNTVMASGNGDGFMIGFSGSF